MVAAEKIAEIEQKKNWINEDEVYRLMVVSNRLGKPEIFYEHSLRTGKELIKELDAKIEVLRNEEIDAQ
jgi:hypothetical protein